MDLVMMMMMMTVQDSESDVKIRETASCSMLLCAW